MTSRDWGGLGLLLIVAACVRAYAWHQTAVLFNDGPIFLAMAEAIGEGRWDAVASHPFHPLYPACIAAVRSLVPVGLETAAIVVSICGGLLSVVGVFGLTRDHFDPVIGWMAAVVVTLHPWAVDFSSDVMSDGLYAGIYLMALFALSRLVDAPRPLLAALFGSLAGLAYLARPEGLGLIVTCVLLLLAKGASEGASRRRTAGALIGVLVAVAFVATPYGVLVQAETGDFSLSRKKSVAGLIAGEAVNLPPEVIETSRAEGSSKPIPLPRPSIRAGASSEARPARTVRGALEAVTRVVRTSMASLRYEVVVFAVCGLLVLWRSGALDRRREGLFFLPAILYSGLLVLLVWGAGYIARRHALAALLPLTAYAAVGFRSLFRWSVQRLGQGADPVRVVGGLVLVLCLVWGARDLRGRRFDRQALRRAGEWLAEHDPSGRPMAGQKLRVAYYADRPFVPLPSGEAGSIENTLKGAGARWLVIDAQRIQDHVGLSEGLGTWLEPVHTVENRGQTALILEIISPPAR